MELFEGAVFEFFETGDIGGGRLILVDSLMALAALFLFALQVSLFVFEHTRHDLLLTL